MARLSAAQLAIAREYGHRLVARIRLTDPRGNPVCARVLPPALE